MGSFCRAPTEAFSIFLFSFEGEGGEGVYWVRFLGGGVDCMYLHDIGADFGDVGEEEEQECCADDAEGAGGDTAGGRWVVSWFIDFFSGGER